MITPDGRTVFLSTNKDRDLIAFGRIRIDEAGKPVPAVRIQVTRQSDPHDPKTGSWRWLSVASLLWLGLKRLSWSKFRCSPQPRSA